MYHGTCPTCDCYFECEHEDTHTTIYTEDERCIYCPSCTKKLVFVKPKKGPSGWERFVQMCKQQTNPQ